MSARQFCEPQIWENGFEVFAIGWTVKGVGTLWDSVSCIMG